MYKLSAALAATLALAAGATSANAAVFVFNAGITAYTQDFNTLTTSGSFASLPAGVLAVETGTNANAAYAVGTGSNNAGDTYSFGTNADRAFGTLRSGSLSPLIGFGFTNNTGRTITDLTVAFTGEQWRLGTTGGRTDRLDFQYALNSTSLTSGTFTDVDALDFATPNTSGTSAGARDGNNAAFRAGRLATISGLQIGSGESFVFRFNDFDASGADDGLAIDDFSLELTLAPIAPPVPEPASWAMMIGGFALIGAASRRRSARTVAA